MVVGSGFSGTLTALHLLGEGAGGARVHLVEKGPKFALGAAYSTDDPDHLLNVRAGNMSAWPDRPGHFLDWLAKHGRDGPVDPFSFVARGVYGAYLQDQLRAVAQGGRAAGRLTLEHDEVVGIRPTDQGFTADLAMGREILADEVVLAIGASPPGPAVAVDATAKAGGAYAPDPWAPGAIGAIRPDERVLLIGAGLTMVDVIASLDARGHRGPITAISRRGLMPRPHARLDGPPIDDVARPGERLSAAVRRLRAEVARSGDWRRAMDGVRPVSQAFWEALPDADRRRFLRHLRPFWDVHRHRMAPPMARRIGAYLASGRLRVVAGRLESLEANSSGLAARWRARGETLVRNLACDRAINCTGPEGDPTRSDQPLIRDILAQGLARPDPLGLGLDADGDGRLISAAGAPTPGLSAIGPITRGALWEITAVPDIRIQARRLAARLAGG